MIRKKLSSLVAHPVTQGTRRFTRRVVATCAVILAAALATTVTVDLGPALRGQAERQGTRFLKRDLHIGRLGVYLWGGQFQIDDLVIDGHHAAVAAVPHRQAPAAGHALEHALQPPHRLRFD